MFFLTFSWSGRTNQKGENDQTVLPAPTSAEHKKLQNLILPNTTKRTKSNLNKEQNDKNKTFQFRLGYLLLGFQLKTLEDFFMELFNYLYFTCQKKKLNKMKVTNTNDSCYLL